MLAFLGKIIFFFSRIKNKCITAYIKKQFRKHGKDIYISKGCVFNDPKNMEIGEHVYFGRNCIIQSVHGDIIIGSHVMFGPGVNIHGGNDRYEIGGGDMDELKKQYGDDPPVLIGSDVWIGANVIILSGAKIGDGAVIGAGSVVTKDIDPYSVAVGNPAKVIKNRKEF